MAIQAWVPFRVPWLHFYAQGPLSAGILVAIVVRRVGLWWVNLNRVVYTIDEPHRFGFAYGTLGLHALSGEELFLVERSPQSGEVTYRILAFSRPRHLLTRLGYPLTRAAQRRFGVDSSQAMQSAMQNPDFVL
ncbi:MAG: DUF1990 domain-containing protein [Leptolyngbya sp. SIO4C1]|nr:DUF1990 domain-containing protein [Leptolyngbya sp. SIO4C1]